MPMPLFPNHPVRNGQTMEMHVLYDWPVPCPGLGLVGIQLGAISPATVDAVMTQRKALFDYDQAISTYHPVIMWLVGMVVDPVTANVTAYVQYQLPWYSRPIDQTTYVYPLDAKDSPVSPLTPIVDTQQAPTNPALPALGVRPPVFPPVPGTSPPAGRSVPPAPGYPGYDL